LCSYTVDVTAAYNKLDEPENVVVTPPAEWLQFQAAEGKPTNVLWRMKKLLPGRGIAAKIWVDHVGAQLKSFGFDQCPGHPQLFYDR
jgi:hypothetical protein